MSDTVQNIWKAVGGLKQADIDSTAMCYSIINLMIKEGVATREEVTRQIEKSVAKVVTVHKQIAEAIREKNSTEGVKERPKTIH